MNIRKDIKRLKRFILNNMGEDILDITEHINVNIPAGTYDFIPHDSEDCVTLINKAIKVFENENKRKPNNFIDLGCGIGNILFLASQFNLELFGVELHQNYIDVANQLVSSATIQQGDLLKWKPEKQYDIVWMYKPLRNKELWLQFLNHFVKVFPVGQIFISPLGMGVELDELNIKQLTSDIYQIDGR